MRANHFQEGEDVYLSVRVDLPGCGGDTIFSPSYAKVSDHQLLIAWVTKNVAK